MATKILPPFKNETYKDFSKASEQKKMADALAAARRQFGKKYPLIINGKKIKKSEYIPSTNPANPDEVIGYFALGGTDDAEKALKAATKTFEEWKRVPGIKRAEYLLKAAKIMRRRRYEINAWMVLEVGKNFLEADADTGEGIDFMEYYAREMIRLSGPQPVKSTAGEKGFLEYIPLGVGFIVPPWNFPFAILAGTAAAAIVTGNTIILKPSSDAPMMGWIFKEIMEEAGLPAGVLNFITAPGGEVGDYVVQSPLTRFISFTGSKEIGLRITERAAKHQPGQKWIKRVVAEMGGKDSIVVAADADSDEAASGIVAAAFGFQGQKCSACSRAIIDRAIYPEVLKKIVEKTNQLEIGNPAEDRQIGPVVSERAYRKILEYINVGKKEGKVLTGGKAVQGTNGYYIEPTVIADVKPNARISQEEIFGPVLAVIPVKNFEEALKVANNTEFGLTGAVYSKSKANLRRAEEEFFVGNLYLNRKCTGALVGVHPFGGFNMSGTDSKAGGSDYLHHFLQAKTIAAKIISLASPGASKKTKTKARAR